MRLSKVDGVNFRLVANSTPLGGRISWRKECMKKGSEVLKEEKMLALWSFLFSARLPTSIPYVHNQPSWRLAIA
jgi:hypothetical protein